MRYALVAVIALMLSVLPAPAQETSRVESPILEALARADVYVAPQLAGTVNESRLQRIANDLKPFTVKFVVVPLRDRRTRDAWASGLRRQLDVRQGAVIVMVPQMPEVRGGVSASSDAIPPAEITRIVQANAAIFTTEGYTQGLEQLARALRNHYVGERRGAAINLGLIFGIPTLLVAGGVGWVIRRRAQEVARLKVRLQEIRAQVLEGIEYLDGYIDVLPDGEDASRARDLRQRAAELQTQAVQLIERARRPEDLWRAEHLLERAQASIEKARKYILRAGGDTSINVEEEPQEPVAEEATVMVRDNDRTYACFFCSKPPTLSQLQPVEVTVGEQTRRVWACEECAEQIERGQTPPIRVIRDGNRARPWYEDPNYDPYRDYGRAYPGMDWVSLLLLGSILMPPAPVIAREPEPVNVGGENPEMDAGGTDWFDPETDMLPPSEYDSAGADWFDPGVGADSMEDAGGTDFFDVPFDGFDGGDVDTGGVDFGDFGGFDAGGGDF